jgi:hypothetical protein
MAGEQLGMQDTDHILQYQLGIYCAGFPIIIGPEVIGPFIVVVKLSGLK